MNQGVYGSSAKNWLPEYAPPWAMNFLRQAIGHILRRTQQIENLAHRVPNPDRHIAVSTPASQNPRPEEDLMEAINQGVALFREYQQTRYAPALARSVGTFARLDGIVPKGSSVRIALVYNHGLALRELAATTKDETLAAQAAMKLHEALHSGLFKGVDEQLPLGELAAAHALRAQICPTPELLSEAEVWTKRFITAVGPKSDLYANLHVQLATLLLLFQEKTGDLSALSKGVDALILARTFGAEAFKDVASGPRFFSAIRKTAAHSEASRLDALIKMAEEEAAAAGNNASLRADWLHSLAHCLYQEYLRAGDAASRDRAFLVLKQRLELVAANESQRVVGRYLPALLSLPDPHQNEFYELGLTCETEAELRKAVAARPHLDEALNGKSQGGDEIQAKWMVAAEVLVRNQKSPNQQDALELATRLHEIVAIPAFRRCAITFQATALDTARGAFFDAYWWTGDFDRLETAITFGREAYEMACELRRRGGGEGSSPGAGHERVLVILGMPVMAHALGVLLTQKCEHTQDVDLIEEAVRLNEEAVERSTGGKELQLFHGSLATALRIRFGLTGDRVDLENAVHHHLEAVTLERDRLREEKKYEIEDGRLAAKSPEPDTLIHLLGNLGNAFRLSYQHFGGHENLTEAIKCHEEVLSLSGKQEASYPRFLNYLFDDLELAAVAGISHSSVRLDELCAHAVALTEGGPNHLIALHSRAGNHAFVQGDWQSATTAFQNAAHDREQLQATQLDAVAKQSWLSETQGLTAKHAFALAKLNRNEQAVQAFESGLARFISESLWWNDSHLERFRLSAPRAVAALQEARRLLQRLDLDDPSGTGPSVATQKIDRALARRNAWSDLKSAEKVICHALGMDTRNIEASVASIRQTLLMADPDCAVVYLCTTSHGSLAVILTVQNIETLWPPMSEEQLENLSRSFKEQGANLHEHLVQGDGTSQPALSKVLDQLGECLMDSVAKKLESMEMKQVLLIPTGRLSLLPLHAAQFRRNGNNVAFIDLFTVSYAPNASVVVAHGNEEPDGGLMKQPVAFRDPASSTHELLSGAEAEVHAINRVLKHGFSDIRGGTNATREAFFALCQRATVLHFAGHGVFNPRSALDSHLVLAADERLSVADLLSQKLLIPKGALAVLAACQTAIVDFEDLPDESIGLPAAFLVAGFSRVVGSLWQVEDTATALLMVRFYELLQLHSGIRRPCELFNEAINWLKNLNGAEWNRFVQKHDLRFPSISDDIVLRDHPALWAGFVYVGK